MSTALRLGLAVLAVLAGGAGRAGLQAASSQEPPAQQGRAIYMGKGACHTCHGPDGRGTPIGPDLTDAEWLHIDGTQAEIARVVRLGVVRPKRYPAPMPPMGGARLNEREITAVAAYVAALRTPQAATARMQQGAATGRWPPLQQ